MCGGSFRVRLAVFVAFLAAAPTLAHEAHRRPAAPPAETVAPPAETVAPPAETVAPPAVETVASPPAEPPVEHHRPPAPAAPPTSAWKRLGHLHPLTVHFPVALLWAAAVAEALRREEAARFLVVAAAVTAPPAAALGLILATGETYGGDLAGAFRWHRASGLAAAALAVVAAVVRAEAIRRGARGLYLAGLAAAVAAVSAAGYLGAEMTFGPGHLFR